MKIVICGSRRFYEEIQEAAQKLRDGGHVVFEPILNRNEMVHDLPPDLKRYVFLGLTHHHFDWIRKADICLIFNPDGYMGNSTTMELAYAVACRLPIYALEKDKEDPCRDCLFDFIVGTVDGFIRDLQ